MEKKVKWIFIRFGHHQQIKLQLTIYNGEKKKFFFVCDKHTDTHTQTDRQKQRMKMTCHCYLSTFYTHTHDNVVGEQKSIKSNLYMADCIKNRSKNTQEKNIRESDEKQNKNKKQKTKIIDLSLRSNKSRTSHHHSYHYFDFQSIIEWMNDNSVYTNDYTNLLDLVEFSFWET